jgi:hypothetical protein
VPQGIVARRLADQIAASVFVLLFIVFAVVALSGAQLAGFPSGQTHTVTIETTEALASPGPSAVPSTRITTDATTTTGPGLLDLLVTPGLLWVLRLGLAAAAAFVAAAMVQRVLLGLYGFSLGPLTVPQITKEDLEAASERLMNALSGQPAAPQPAVGVRTEAGPASGTGAALDAWIIASPSDPSLQLVSLRIEIEKRLRQLATTRGIRHAGSSAGLLRELTDQGAIDQAAASALADLIGMGNRAAHGVPVSDAAGEWATRYGPGLLDVLDRYVAGG